MNTRKFIEEFKSRLKAPWVALKRVAHERYLPEVFAKVAWNEIKKAQKLIDGVEKSKNTEPHCDIMAAMKEITADIRNKLQRIKTTLEKLSKGETVSKGMAVSALVDLSKIIRALKALEDKDIR